MVFEKYVEKKRRGYALASTVGLIFLLTILLGVAISRLDYSLVVIEAYSNRFKARNALESMTNLALKWLKEDVKKTEPRDTAELENLTDFDSLLIFTSSGFNGCEVKVYNLNYKIAGFFAVPYVLPSSFEGGYMIRATVERTGMAPMMLESVYEVVPVGDDASVVWVLDDGKPVYSRELFQR